MKDLCEMLNQLLYEAKDLYAYYPNRFRQSANEYFEEEEKAVKEAIKIINKESE